LVSLTRLLTIFILLFPLSVFAFCFEEAGNEYGISSNLLEALARTESGMNPKAMNINTNGSYDMGLMQINSYWLIPLVLDKDKLTSDPCYNVMIGARILKYCIGRFGYNWEAVGCYNATSLNKKMSYSWKVFRSLTAKQARPTIRPTSDKQPSSSLIFEVRDIMESRDGRP
jgi:soluble lytic murein transglycosylase-like protein